MANPPKQTDTSSPPSENRRSFFAVFAALVTGAIATLTPLAAGLFAFLSPLMRKSKSPQVRIALLDQVPDDGIPRYFPVIADREDAWNRYPKQRVGAVYLSRQPGAADPVAFTPSVRMRVARLAMPRATIFFGVLATRALSIWTALASEGTTKSLLAIWTSCPSCCVRLS